MAHFQTRQVLNLNQTAHRAWLVYSVLEQDSQNQVETVWQATIVQYVQTFHSPLKIHAHLVISVHQGLLNLSLAGMENTNQTVGNHHAFLVQLDSIALMQFPGLLSVQVVIIALKELAVSTYHASEEHLIMKLVALISLLVSHVWEATTVMRKRF